LCVARFQESDGEGFVLVELIASLVVALLVGGFIGIGINVLATRLPSELPLLGPALGTTDNLPAPAWHVPYFGARDRESGLIDWPNFGTQIGAAIVSAGALLLHGFSFSALEAIALSAVLLTILRIDWQHHLIFMLTIWPGILLALAFSLLTSTSQLLSSIIAGLAAAAVFLLLYLFAILIYKRRALGLGDVFLAGLIGTMVGLPFIAQTIFLGMLAGALGGLFLIAIKVRTRKDYIPYGAYLSFATIIVVLLVA
jgi:leader peptidase (prepilin peptidase)/N-methyltransferase